MTTMTFLTTSNFNRYCQQYKIAVESGDSKKRLEAMENLTEFIKECLNQGITLTLTVTDTNRLAIKRLLVANQAGVAKIFDKVESESPEDGYFIENFKNPTLKKKLLEELKNL